jgi:hypothetical protein
MESASLPYGNTIRTRSRWSGWRHCLVGLEQWLAERLLPVALYGRFEKGPTGPCKKSGVAFEELSEGVDCAIQIIERWKLPHSVAIDVGDHSMGKGSHVLDGRSQEFKIVLHAPSRIIVDVFELVELYVAV